MSRVRPCSTGRGRWRSSPAAAACCSPHEATSRARSRASSARSSSTHAPPTRSTTRGRSSHSAERNDARRGAATPATTLEDALARFERLGAPLWAEQTRTELARIGGRAASDGALTDAESRIAALVAQGHTNREVAAALFLTPHSVETALTRIYRKLGVRSRTELARRYPAKT